MILPLNDHSGPSAPAQINTAKKPVLLQAKLPRNNSPTLRVSQEGRFGGSAPQGPCHSRRNDSYYVRFPSNTTTHTELQVFLPKLPSIFLCHCIREYQAGWAVEITPLSTGSPRRAFAHSCSREMLIKCRKSTFCISQDMPCCLFN